MRDHSGHVSGDRHQVVEALLERTDFQRRTEIVDVAQADGRVAACEYRSLTMLPNTRASNMDAVAVRWEAFEGGEPDVSSWQRGRDWEFCNTGVAMPEGFDTAIRIEDVELSDDDTLAGILKMPRERHDATTAPGARLMEGDLLVAEGERLTPALLSVLNMGGYTEVEVAAKPRVGFIPTGNELWPAGAELPLGKNVESNATMICAKIAAWGGEPVRYGIVPDDPAQILESLQRAAAECDVVVINAGSSKGSDDWTCEILEREGEVLFHQVNQGPGRHCSFSVLSGKPVVGISGPPFGAEFTADFFIKPFVDAYLGAGYEKPPAVMARMLDSMPLQPRPVTICKRAFVRREENGGFVAWQAKPQGRPELREVDSANGMICLDRDGYGYQEGELFPVELRWPYTLPPLM
ncbi:MAG: molybdopterin molybdotransferase MoeA [Coriobacteriales bacterium]